jgi:hypothetical protein
MESITFYVENRQPALLTVLPLLELRLGISKLQKFYWPMKQTPGISKARKARQLLMGSPHETGKAKARLVFDFR